MATLDIIDLSGKRLGQLEVSDEVFASEVKEHLLWEVVRYQRAARRAGTASTKGRSEVHRTGKKSIKQKGSGGARHGSRRVNLYPGGGQVHGPKPRSYAFHVNKKVMASALRSALSLRASAGDLIVVRDFALPGIKTKLLVQALTKLSAPRVLIVDEANDALRLCARNLQNVSFLEARGLNVYDILRFPKLIVSEACVRTLDQRLSATREQQKEAAA